MSSECSPKPSAILIKPSQNPLVVSLGVDANANLDRAIQVNEEEQDAQAVTALPEALRRRREVEAAGKQSGYMCMVHKG